MTTQRVEGAAMSSALRHGHARKGAPSKEYRAYNHMLRRCYSPKERGFHRYGGRGITVCDRWRTGFAAFLADVGPAPSPKHTIDRIDNDGNYEPSNCRWATHTEQSRNKSQNRLIEIDGEALPIVVWSERSGIPANRIQLRLARGWSARAAVFEPAPKNWSRQKGAVIG